MCVLCRDTFSRSDILKRHFQKCSIRRGNPTGASHLSHAQAHLKKSHPGPHKSSNSMSNESELMGVNGMSNVFGVVPNGDLPDAGSGLTDQQAQDVLSRSNSLKRLSAGDGRDGRGMVGLGPGTSNRAGFDQSYGGALGGSPMPGTGMNPSLAFNLPHGQNGHSYGQGQGYDYVSHGNSSSVQPHPASGQEWSQMQIFQPNGPESFMSAYNPSITNSHVSIKTEPSLTHSSHGIFSGIYSGIATSSSIPSWNLQNDPLEEISNRLIYFCFPNDRTIGRNNDIRSFLSAGNIKHFLEHFTSFQGHFPILHIPTFRITEAFDGLLLGMICIGAVYSDRMTTHKVREIMEQCKAAIERNSQIYTIVSREQTRDSGFGDETIGSSKSDLEQITAIFMMQVLFTWHGTPLQREKARREFPLVAEIARRAGLTKPMTTSPFSVLHQPNVTVENFNAASFDWNAWVEQEKRSRLMFTLFLIDAALSLYFNLPPQFEKDEIRLPLPADDAAWDAATSPECAEALGLHGPAVARSRNPDGSRRPKQPEMHSALNALMHNVWDLQPGTTNLYSKFILIHALHIQLWTALRQMSLQESGQLNSQNLSFPSSGTTTPINQHDWVQRVDLTGSGLHSASTSGRATPVLEAVGQAALLKSINNAFDKWKKAWDEDMASQYPPSSTHYHRFGFCRDGVHFYWLAKYLMKNNRSMDWQIAPDQRFAQVINLLKSVRTWVVSDSAKRGEELGSVSDIGSDYGVTDLTLDMAQLFRPINKQIDSPVPGVHTNIGMA
jgi:Fungal specific transcription factor domain